MSFSKNDSPNRALFIRCTFGVECICFGSYVEQSNAIYKHFFCLVSWNANICIVWRIEFLVNVFALHRLLKMFQRMSDSVQLKVSVQPHALMVKTFGRLSWRDNKTNSSNTFVFGFEITGCTKHHQRFGALVQQNGCIIITIKSFAKRLFFLWWFLLLFVFSWWEPTKNGCVQQWAEVSHGNDKGEHGTHGASTCNT